MTEAREEDVDIVIIATSPRHYTEIKRLIAEKCSAKLIITLYEEQSTETLEEPDVKLLVKRRVGFINEADVMLPIIKARSALIMIDIWNFNPDEPCFYCDKLPSLIELFDKNNLPVLNAPSLISENDTLIEKKLVPKLQRERQWPPDNFAFRDNEYSYLDTVKEFYDKGGEPPRWGCQCATSGDSRLHYTVITLEEGLDILEKHGVVNVFYVGGGIHQCLMYKPMGWINLRKEGYLPIMVRDVCNGADAYFDGVKVPMSLPGIVHFEARCGHSTTADALKKAFR